MNRNVLAPLTGRVQSQSDPVVIDIETWGLDARPSAFAFGIVWDGVSPRLYYKPEEMRVYLTHSHNLRGRQIYGHNAGGFDYYAIFGDGTPAGLLNFFGSENVIINGSRFIEATYTESDNVRRFRDSMNLMPTSVEKIGEKLGFPKGKTPQKFIDADRSQAITQEDIDYCLRDCQVVLKGLMELKGVTGELRATIPSTAMAVFRRAHMPAPVWIRRVQDELFRAAYYGGRVEAYHIGALPQPNFYYDVNSLYPYAMTYGAYPTPQSLKSRRDVSVTDLVTLMQDYEGCASVSVRHPETYIGYLPYVSNYDSRLVFPVGRFSGTWCFPELRYAMSRGLEIESVAQVSYSPRVPSPFDTYVSTYYTLKQNEPEGGFMREVYKLLLNGLYGKFAESHRSREIYSTDFSPQRYNELLAQFPDVTWRALGKNRTDGYYVYQEDDIVTSHTIYCWASYVTSYARVINAKLQDEFRSAGARVYYTDTDSFLSDNCIVADKNLAYLQGDGLGQLKLEAYGVKTIFGNKDYVRTDTDKLTGLEITRLKGVPKNAKKTGTQSFQYTTITKLREAIRRGVEAGTPRVVDKTLTRDYTKRRVLDSGETKAFVL